MTRLRCYNRPSGLCDQGLPSLLMTDTIVCVGSLIAGKGVSGNLVGSAPTLPQAQLKHGGWPWPFETARLLTNENSPKVTVATSRVGASARLL